MLQADTVPHPVQRTRPRTPDLTGLGRGRCAQLGERHILPAGASKLLESQPSRVGSANVSPMPMPQDASAFPKCSDFTRLETGLAQDRTRSATQEL